MTATVRELIETLKGVPEDAEVYVEGCDCDGEASGEIDMMEPWGNHKLAVLIKRDHDA